MKWLKSLFKKDVDKFNIDMLQLNQKLLEEGFHNAKV